MHMMTNNTCSGSACPDDINGDDWIDFPNLRDYQPTTDCDDLLGDFDFPVAVSCNEARPEPFQLPPGVTGLKSPPSTPPNGAAPTFGPSQCPETGLLALSCNPAMLGDVYANVLHTHQFSAYPFLTDDLGFGPSGSDLVFTQDADDGTASSRSHPTPASSPVASGQVSEKRVLKRGTSSKRARAKSQRKIHRCESQIAKAEFPYEQTTCGQIFTRFKDLKRHKLSVHRNDDDPVYVCRCGKDNPRKDNHIRHVETCAKPPCRSSYACKCSHTSENRQEHLEHVTSCSHGFGFRGRPSVL